MTNRDPVESKLGLRVHKPDEAYQGYTLFCNYTRKLDPSVEVSGEIHLLDMDGEPAHVWPVRTSATSHGHLLPNGNLLYPTADRTLIEEAGLLDR